MPDIETSVVEFMTELHLAQADYSQLGASISSTLSFSDPIKQSETDSSMPALQTSTRPTPVRISEITQLVSATREVSSFFFFQG